MYKPAKPLRMITQIPAGYPIEPDAKGIIKYLPVFTCEELGKMTAEMHLERTRAFYAAYGQYDDLERLDKEVEEKGNPFERKPLRFSEDAVKAAS